MISSLCHRNWNRESQTREFTWDKMTLYLLLLIESKLLWRFPINFTIICCLLASWYWQLKHLPPLPYRLEYFCYVKCQVLPRSTYLSRSINIYKNIRGHRICQVLVMCFYILFQSKEIHTKPWKREKNIFANQTQGLSLNCITLSPFKNKNNNKILDLNL